jgi:hypothetical protein
MDLIKEFYKTLTLKQNKTAQDYNKIIFFNMLMRVMTENKLTEAEREAMRTSANLINQLYN